MDVYALYFIVSGGSFVSAKYFMAFVMFGSSHPSMFIIIIIIFENWLCHIVAVSINVVGDNCVYCREA